MRLAIITIASAALLISLPVGVAPSTEDENEPGIVYYCDGRVQSDPCGQGEHAWDLVGPPLAALA